MPVFAQFWRSSREVQVQRTPAVDRFFIRFVATAPPLPPRRRSASIAENQHHGRRAMMSVARQHAPAGIPRPRASYSASLPRLHCTHQRRQNPCSQPQHAELGQPRRADLCPCRAERLQDHRLAQSAAAGPRRPRPTSTNPPAIKVSRPVGAQRRRDLRPAVAAMSASTPGTAMPVTFGSASGNRVAAAPPAPAPAR